MKLVMSKILLPVALVTLTFLTTCTAGNGPNDLMLTSLTMVDYRDQSELLQTNYGVLNTRGKAPSTQPVLLLAKIASATNLSRLPYTGTLGVRAFFCTRPNSRAYLNLPYIFMNGRDIRRELLYNDPQNSNEMPYVYDIYLRVSLSIGEIGDASPKAEPFNLFQSPEDVCIQLVGGNYRALGYASNVVKISARQIEVELRDSRPHH